VAPLWEASLELEEFIHPPEFPTWLDLPAASDFPFDREGTETKMERNGWKKWRRWIKWLDH